MAAHNTQTLPSERALPPDAAEIVDRYGRLDGMPLMEVMMRERFQGRIALLSAFGAESAVLLDLAARIDPGVRVIFLDTRRHFPQTLEYYRLLVGRLGLTNVHEARPGARAEAVRDPAGNLHRTDPDACCGLRKVEPLAEALEGYQAWITGRKRYQAGERTTLPTVEYVDGRIKINPLARWTRADIDGYFSTRRLPRHPLAPQGYASVGCAPCTRPTLAGEGARSGRWTGAMKTECGIHAPRALDKG